MPVAIQLGSGRAGVPAQESALGPCFKPLTPHLWKGFSVLGLWHPVVYLKRHSHLVLSDLSHLLLLVFSDLAQTLALLESSSQPPLPGGRGGELLPRLGPLSVILSH